MGFITENIGTIAVLLVIIFLCIMAIRSIIKKKKCNISPCGCACSGCSIKDMEKHTVPNDKFKKFVEKKEKYK